MTFLKAALPPSCYRTGTRRWTLCLARGEAVSIPPTDDTLPTASSRSRRFAWPSGGTEEFLGRWFARTDSWDTEAKGVLADPLYVFGAAGRTGTPGVVPPDRDGNRKDRTSRCRQEGRLLVTRGITVPNRSSSSREFRGARLDFSVHICVRPKYPGCPCDLTRMIVVMSIDAVEFNSPLSAIRFEDEVQDERAYQFLFLVAPLKLSLQYHGFAIGR
jgi:hypothetical protein